MTHNVKFKVSLSNGDIFFEGKGEMIDTPESSAWAKLDKYCMQNKVDIVHMSLYTDDGREFHLPSAANRPSFRAFFNLEKPLDYNCYRKLFGSVNGGGAVDAKQLFTVIEAIYETHSLQLWVDENNINNCYGLCVQHSNNG